jgi:cytochrome c556
MKIDLKYVPHAVVIGAAVSIAGLFATPLLAQAPAAAPTPLSQARQIVETRRAIYTLIGANFRPLGAVLKGEKPYDAADAEKRLARIVFLTALLDEAFPDSSNIGLPDSKTKAEAWSNRDDFGKKLKEFQDNTAALQKVNLAEKSGTDAFKTALKTVAQNCKGCHDDYKEK